MLNFVLGGCGTGKSTRLMEYMQADIDSKKEVLVIVPEQFSFEEEKKLYSFMGANAFNQIRTFSFATISREILQIYGKNARAERYANDQEKLVILYRAFQNMKKRGELHALARRKDTAVFTEELLALVVKLRKARVTPQKLLDTSALLSDRLCEKTVDIAMILLEFERILTEQGLCDGLTDLTEAAMIADVQGYFKGKNVYIDEFDSFTGDQYGMLDSIISQAENVHIAIRTDEPDAKISPVFEGGNRTYRALMRIAKDDYHIPVSVDFCDVYKRSSHTDLQAVSTQILRPKTSRAEYSGHVHIMEATDPIAEAEYIGATICRMLSDDSSLRCRDIAVAVKSLDTYGSILERAFTRYELPYHISSAVPILHTELMRHLLSVLSILADDEWDTDAILRYLKNPFSGYHAVSVSMLEHFCFTWSIENKDWLKPFYGEDSELAERAESFGGEKLEKIREGFVKEISKLRKACTGKTVREICTGLYNHLLFKRKLQEKMESSCVSENQDFSTIWNLLMEIMDTIVSCCGEEVMEIAELYEMFRMMIGSSSFSTPPRTLDSIQVVEAQTARLNNPAVVFVPGVVENAFPGEIKLGGMFTRQELEQLGEKGITISRMFFELYSDERLIVHKIFSAPTQDLFLSYSAVNTAGESQHPSSVIRQICAIFPDAQDLIVKEQELPLTYFVRTHASAYFHFVRNLAVPTPELAALQQILEQHPLYSAKIRKLVQPLTSGNHAVSAENMKNYLGDTLSLSPSGIECFFSCPFQYFCNYCLHLFSPEKNSFSDNNVGNFAHFCFEQILKKYSIEQFTELTAAQLTREIHELSDAFSAVQFSDAVRRDARFQLNYRMTGMGLLKILQHMQREMKDTHFVPLGFEMQVNGKEQDGVIPPLILRDGTVTCNGKIDRVDLCEQDGMSILRVVDYKTGNRIFEPEKLADGLDMQMLIYLIALKHSGMYENPVAGGVLYMPSGQMKLKHYYEREKMVKASEILDDYYRMKGLLLESAAGLMEPEISEAGVPILTPKKSDIYTVDQAQMDVLEEHVTDKICEMADTLYAGKIAPKPYRNIPCEYCGYSDLCGVERQQPKTMKKNERLAAISAVFHKDDAAENESVNDASEKEGEA